MHGALGATVSSYACYEVEGQIKIHIFNYHNQENPFRGLLGSNLLGCLSGIEPELKAPQASVLTATP